ncbi:MAG: PAS domain S-box protein [Candidatus Methanoperedens sp.]|nr:PAS domain S-box protein [Candidatus Methanoperedens sp.]
MEAAEPGTVFQKSKSTGMNWRRHCCAISIFVFMALLLVSFAYQMHPALAAQEDKEIIAGVPANFPPQYQVDAKTGKPYGFAIDVMDEVARRSGIKARYVVYGNFSEVIAALRKGEIDVVPNLGITDERKNYTDFTTPVEASHIHIFVRSTANGIKNIDELTGLKVAVVAENQGYFIMKERSGSKLLVYNSMEEALMSLISGNADAMVYPEEPLLRVARQSGIEDRIKSVGDALAEIKRAIGVRKGQPELYNKLDNAVKVFILTPEYAKIYSKWYGKPEPYWNTQRVLTALGITITLAAIIFFVIHYFSVLRLNKKLRESEEKYRNLVERSNDGILIIQDGLVKFTNARLAELWGSSAEELLETPIIQHIHPDERDKVMERYQRRMTNEDVPPIYETVLLRKDGTTVNIEINAGVISYKGKPADLVMIRDITERKRAEELLRENQALLDLALRSARMGVWHWNIIENRRYFDDQVCHLLGIDSATFTGAAEEFFGAVHPDDRETIKAALARTIEQNVPYEPEYRAVWHDGSVHYITARGRLVRDDKGGRALRINGIIWDITEHKKAEKEITFLASIVKNVPDAVCSIDLNGNIFSWNKGAEKMLGYKAEEIIGKPITITIPEERAQKELDHCIGILNAQGFFTDYESVRLTKDGRVIPVEITAVALKDREQNITSYTSIIKDITERKKAEALHLENLRLEFMDKAKSEFLANMSHELRTPLNAIIGFSELMKQGITGKMNEKQERFIDNILSSGTFLLSLINDILDLSKIEAGKIELCIEKFSVNQAVDKSLILIKERASKHNIIIKKEFSLHLDIGGDKQRFKQVLFNLLSNAVKFSKEGGGMVTIKTEKEGDMARISVSDTGIGIKEENIGKLFKKFQQLEPEISGKYGGTGLGLAISKQLVELHGGKIRAESKYGKGSTFTFLLPLKAKIKEENK